MKKTRSTGKGEQVRLPLIEIDTNVTIDAVLHQIGIGDEQRGDVGTVPRHQIANVIERATVTTVTEVAAMRGDLESHTEADTTVESATVEGMISTAASTDTEEVTHLIVNGD